MLASGLSSDKGSSRRPVGVEFVFEESSHSCCFVARIDSFCTCVESLYSILDSFHSRCLSSLGCLGFFGFVVVLIRLYSPVEVESVFKESSPTFCFFPRIVSFCFVSKHCVLFWMAFTSGAYRHWDALAFLFCCRVQSM